MKPERQSDLGSIQDLTDQAQEQVIMYVPAHVLHEVMMRYRTEKLPDVHLEDIPTILSVVGHPLLYDFLPGERPALRYRPMNVLIHSLLDDRLQHIHDHMMQDLLVEARDDDLALLPGDPIIYNLGRFIPVFVADRHLLEVRDI